MINRFFKTVYLFIIIIGLMIAGGCSAFFSPETDSKPATIKQLDSAKTTAVKVSLSQDPEMSGTSIKAEVYGTECILKGEAPSEELKQKAEKLAMKVKGVEQVRNNIQVKQ